VDTTTGALVSATNGGVRRLLVLAVRGIVLGVVLAGLGRITGAFLAASMFAALANLLVAEVGLATVALAVDTLADLLANQVRSSVTAWDGEAVRNITLTLLAELLLQGGLLLLLGLLSRVASASLAPLVSTGDADLVGAIGRLALVASAVDPHTDGLEDTLRLGSGLRSGPFAGLDLQSMLLKQGLGTLGSGEARRRRTSAAVEGSRVGSGDLGASSLDRSGRLRGLGSGLLLIRSGGGGDGGGGLLVSTGSGAGGLLGLVLGGEDLLDVLSEPPPQGDGTLGKTGRAGHDEIVEPN